MQLSKLNIPDFSKIPAFLFAALLLNIAIFMLIQQLVNKEPGFDVKLDHFSPVEFVRIKQQEPPKPEEEDIDPTPSITDQAPPPPEMLEPKIQGVRSRGINQALSKIYVPLSRSGISQKGSRKQQENRRKIWLTNRSKMKRGSTRTQRLSYFYQLLLSRCCATGTNCATDIERSYGGIHPVCQVHPA